MKRFYESAQGANGKARRSIIENGKCRCGWGDGAFVRSLISKESRPVPLLSIDIQDPKHQRDVELVGSGI
jgi:hypothetical protein